VGKHCKRQEVTEPIARSAKNDHGNAILWEILLERKIAVYGDEHIELLLREGKQFTVLDRRPAHLGNRLHVVVQDACREPTVDALVEQHPHEADATIRSFASLRKATT